MDLDRKIALSIQANTKKAEADIKRLQSQLTRLSSVKLGAVQTQKLTTGLKNAGQQATRTSTQMEKLGGRINAAFNVAIVVGFTRALANAGDEMLNITNKLMSVGVEAKNVGKETAFLLKTANATRTSIGSMATVYSRVKRSVSDLNYTTAQTQKATTAIAQSFQLAGTTAAEATASTIQLAQGLSSGALRGDELRSVLEGNRVLTEAIAKELNVGVGELRALGAEGKITSDIVMRALLNDADSMNDKFGKLKPTFENSFAVLKNGLTTAVGEATNILGDALGIKDAFIDAGKALTEMFLDGRVKVFVGEFVRDFREASARIKGFFADTFDSLGLELPDLTDILSGLATLLGVKLLSGSRKGQTAFTPIRADVASLDTQVKNLRATMAGGFPIGKATGLGSLQQGLGQTKTSAEDLRKSIAKGFSAGRVSGFGPIFQNVGQASTSTNALRTNLGKGFAMGALTGIDKVVNPLSAIGTQVATLRSNLGKGFKIGPSSSTEGGSGGGGGGAFLIAPAQVASQKEVVKALTAQVSAASVAVQGYANGVSRFFGNISTSIGAMADRADFKLTVLDDAIEKNKKGLDKATTAYNKHSGAINRLGLLYDGLADKDFGTDKERSLAARLDAESAKLNEARASMGRYNASLSANEAARGTFITGLEAQQKAFTKTQRVFARMAGVMNVQLPTLRGGFDKLATAATNVGTAFSTMATNAQKARNNIKGIGSKLTTLQGGASGQIAGTVGTTMVLSEFFTFDKDTQTFENDFIEKVRSGISNAIQNIGGFDKEQADLGAKLTTFIAGAVSAFLVVSTIAGAIASALATVLASPLVLTAAVIAATIYIATSESELAEQLRGLVAGAIEGLINLPVNLLTGSTGTVQDRQSEAMVREQDAGNPLDSAMIAARTNTTFRGLTEEDVRAMIATWETEANHLMSQGALSRMWNSPVINTYQAAISKAEAKLLRMEQAAEKAGTALSSVKAPPQIPAITAQPFASGGFISGPGTGTSDDIPAMLSDGEYVIKASSVSKFGAGFMAKINAGIMPQMFSEGGAVKANPEALQRLYDEQAQDRKAIASYRPKLPSSSNGFTSGLSTSETGIYDALNTNILERGAVIAGLEAQNKRAAAGAGAGPSSAPTSKTETPKQTEAEKIGISYAKKFQNDFNSGLKQLLRDGDVKGFLTGLLDSFTGGIIDSVVDGFTNSLFGKSAEEGGVLSNLFSGMFNFGGSVKDGVQKSTLDGVKAGGMGEGGFLSGISGFFSNAFKGLGDMFKGGGAGGGGGFLSGLLGMVGSGGLFSSIFGSSFGSILGFSQGGVVPNTPFSQTGKDSVPAMLMPGEVVLSKNAVSRMDRSNQTSTQNFSINVTGDVDRQTRKQIVKMMPQIASGVNMTNKENNFRGR